MTRLNRRKLRVPDDDEDDEECVENNSPSLDELMRKPLVDEIKTGGRDICGEEKAAEDGGEKPSKIDAGCYQKTKTLGAADETTKKGLEKIAVDIYSSNTTPATRGILTTESKGVDPIIWVPAPERTRTRRPLGAVHTNSLRLPLSRTLRERLPDQGCESEDSEDGPIRRIVRANPSTDVDDKSSRGVRETPRRATKGIRTHARRQSFPVEEEETAEESDDAFDSLDDFIVGDDEDISYYDTQDESEEEDERLTKAPSPRKLYRAITPKSTWNKENNYTRLSDSEKALQLNLCSHADEMEGSSCPQNFVKL